MEQVLVMAENKWHWFQLLLLLTAPCPSKTAFCETDLPRQQLFQNSQFTTHILQTDL